MSDAMAHAAERVTAAPPMSALKGVFRWATTDVVVDERVAHLIDRKSVV